MSAIVWKRRRRKPEINLVPLIDVLTTLIFFFLVSMQFKNLPTLNLVLPKIETAGKNTFADQIELAVSPEGELFYNGTKVTDAELERVLKAAAEVDRKIPVLILADEESKTGRLAFVMDACRRSGLERINLQSR